MTISAFWRDGLLRIDAYLPDPRHGPAVQSGVTLTLTQDETEALRRVINAEKNSPPYFPGPV
jgi:hypothetical protein